MCIGVNRKNSKASESRKYKITQLLSPTQSGGTSVAQGTGPD
ncbi:MAG TPA: hypothetical protein VHO03_01640 [Ignavibacteriales bacterium]|nr:hypothetical protein [Ignavibacteriales bacterium]